jgi:hypothetical protein
MEYVVGVLLGFAVPLFARAVLVVVGMVAHGVFDFVHAGLIEDSGVPRWWPMFCLMFDVAAGAYLAWRLFQPSGVTAEPSRRS